MSYEESSNVVTHTSEVLRSAYKHLGNQDLESSK